jgi:hypothetical protein
MKSLVITSLAIVFLAGLFSGCMSIQSPNAEFVQSINFSALDTFSYKHTLVSGMDWRDSEKNVAEDRSENVLSAELLSRGFEQVDEGADFYVVTKWRKAVSSYPGVFDHIDDAYEALTDHRKPTHKISVRHTLIVELYDSSTGNVFWRNELPNIFDAIQFTEERITKSLERAIKKFPAHIEKDPNLQNFK